MGDWVFGALLTVTIVLGNFVWFHAGKQRGQILANKKNDRWLQRLRERIESGQDLTTFDALQLWGREWFPEIADEEIANEWAKHIAQRRAGAEQPITDLDGRR